MNDVNPAAAQGVVEEFAAAGLCALALPADVSRKAEVAAMIEKAE